jgi:hypothetical protein
MKPRPITDKIKMEADHPIKQPKELKLIQQNKITKLEIGRTNLPLQVPFTT